MEEKLYAAAFRLPEPQCGFSDIVALAQEQKAKKTPNRKARLVALVTVLCLLVSACAYSSTKYGLWGGYSSKSYKDAQRAAEKFDFAIPKTLHESSFEGYSEANGAPEGYSHLQALLMPTYKLYNVRYAMEKEEILEDGSTRWWEEKVISIHFGTTEQEPWRYHFSVAEDGSKNYHGINPGSSTEEYGGYILHLYSIGDSHSVMWEDVERKMILDMTCYDLTSQGEALEIAKMFIDMNCG